jgi:hypothetical protein
MLLVSSRLGFAKITAEQQQAGWASMKVNLSAVPISTIITTSAHLFKRAAKTSLSFATAVDSKVSEWSVHSLI